MRRSDKTMARPLQLIATDDLHPLWPFPMAVRADSIPSVSSQNSLQSSPPAQVSGQKRTLSHSSSNLERTESYATTTSTTAPAPKRRR